MKPARPTPRALLAVAACVAVACSALGWMAASGEPDRPILTLLGADAALGLVLFASRGDLDPRGRDARWASLARWAAAALLVELVAGFAMFPLTLGDGASPDYGWFPAVAMVVGLLGVGALMLALVVCLMVVSPIVTVARHLRAALTGDAGSGVAVLLSLLLLDVVPLALCLVPTAGGGRGHLLHNVLVLLGPAEPLPGASPVTLWSARLLAVALVAILVGLLRVARRVPGRPWVSRGGRP